jgi:hypothetical protein
MQLRTEVEIEAPVAVVWKVLVDRATYHEWNPFITSFEGPLEEGGTISVVVSPPDSGDFRFRPRLLRFQPEKEIRWKGKVLADFLFAGEHYIQLLDLGHGRTKVCHGEDFAGMLLKLMGRQIEATARGFVLMNHALKRRAEATFSAEQAQPLAQVGN